MSIQLRFDFAENDKNYILQLKQNQSLDYKIELSKKVIIEYYEKMKGQVYISFSGGKDSTVLLHLVRNIYPNIKAVFSNTGLEYPEIVDFVNTIDNVEVIKPKMNFKKVIEKYGYPVISKEQSQYLHQYRVAKSEKTKETRLKGNKWGQGKISKKWLKFIDSDFKVSDQCCNKLKKEPFKIYEKETGLKPFIGTMVTDSSLRKQQWFRTGCNNYKGRITSKPLSFWNEEDIYKYIETRKLKISSIYDLGYRNTGCMFCAYGLHLEKGINKFQIMKETHPKQYNYCITKLGLGKILDFINIKY